jgi:aspartyl/glutamyl-tRNA(Asn/Gln) amidotransferase C subunit
MASSEDVQKLAALARIEVPETDLKKFAAEFDSILAYVGKLEQLDIEVDRKDVPTVRNVFRADGEPHASGRYTEKLAEQFSKRDGDYLQVKQIITHD